MAGPITFLRRVRMIFSSDERNLFLVPRFAAAHKDMLIIVCDPQSDRVFATHRGKMVNGRIRSAAGKTTHVVRDMLKYSQFRFHIDEFLAVIADTTKIPLPSAQQFYQFLDGAIFNISKTLKKRKAAYGPPGPIRSPYQSAVRKE